MMNDVETKTTFAKRILFCEGCFFVKSFDKCEEIRFMLKLIELTILIESSEIIECYGKNKVLEDCTKYCFVIRCSSPYLGWSPPCNEYI